MKNAEPPIPVLSGLRRDRSLGSTASSPGGKGSVSTTSYFRSLATRCLTSARRCSDQFAKEEFRRLAVEFEAKAAQLERSNLGSAQGGWRPRGGPAGSRVMPEHTLGRR